MDDWLKARLIRFAKQEPKCGEDFCDDCGDCLACFGPGGCVHSRGEDSQHLWVVYLDDVPASLMPELLAQVEAETGVRLELEDGGTVSRLW